MIGRMLKATLVATVVVSTTGGLAFADELRIGGTGAAHRLMTLLGDVFFQAAARTDTVEVVPGLGSAGGIAAVTDGALQLAVSGRPLKPEERETGLKSLPLLETPFIFVTSHSSS